MGTRTNGIVVALLSLAVANGCTMLHSVAVAPDQQDQLGDYVYRLPKTMVRIRSAGTTNLSDLEIKTRTVRDPNQEYLINYEPSALSSDDLKIERARDDWALGSVNGTADDQTHTVLKNLGKSLGRIEGQGLGRLLTTTDAPTKLWFEFDPHDPESLKAAKAVLASSEPALDVQCVGCKAQSPRMTGTIDGIPTRTKSLRHLIICKGTCDDPRSQRRLFTFQTFNDSPVVALKVGRSFFVKRETTITFHEGEVAKVQIKKPSEAAQAAALPGEFVASVAAGFTEGLQSQGAVADAQGVAIDKQMALQGKQLQLMQKELELERTRIQNEACRQKLEKKESLPAECTTAAGAAASPGPAAVAPPPPAPAPPVSPAPAPAPTPSEGQPVPGPTNDPLFSGDSETDRANDENDPN